jgi:hypothetical protein
MRLYVQEGADGIGCLASVIECNLRKRLLNTRGNIMCKHKYRARLSYVRIYPDVSHQAVELGYDETTLIKVCVRCGKVKSKSWELKLTEEDFVGTKVGDMLERSKYAENDSNAR